MRKTIACLTLLAVLFSLVSCRFLFKVVLPLRDGTGTAESPSSPDADPSFETTDFGFAQIHIEFFRYRLRQRSVGIACKQFDFGVVCDHLLSP